MSLNRIYFSSFLIKKEDFFEMSSDKDGDIYDSVKIRQNFFSYCKYKFEKLGYIVKEDLENKSLIVENNGNKFNFSSSSIIFRANPENVNFSKMFQALADIGINKMSASDLNQYDNIQRQIKEFNSSDFVGNKKVIRFNNSFEKIGDAEYIDKGNLSDITTIARAAKKEIKQLAQKGELVNEQSKKAKIIAYRDTVRLNSLNKPKEAEEKELIITPVTIFGKFKPLRNDKSTDYDMTINHFAEVLDKPLIEHSDLNEKIFKDDELANKVSSQWKSYINDEGIKHISITENVEDKQVNINSSSVKNAWLFKRGISKVQNFEISDYGNRIDIRGDSQPNLYNNIVEMAYKRGFRTIYFGKIIKKEHKEKLLLTCAKYGISPKGTMPISYSVWEKAKDIVLENGHDWSEFSKYKDKRKVKEKEFSVDQVNKLKENTMVG